MRTLRFLFLGLALAALLAACRSECATCAALDDATRVEFQLCLSETPGAAESDQVCADVALVYVMGGAQ